MFTDYTDLIVGFTDYTDLIVGFTDYTDLIVGFTDYTDLTVGFTDYTDLTVGFTDYTDLIVDFTDYTDLFVGFVMRWLIVFILRNQMVYIYVCLICHLMQHNSCGFDRSKALFLLQFLLLCFFCFSVKCRFVKSFYVTQPHYLLSWNDCVPRLFPFLVHLHV